MKRDHLAGLNPQQKEAASHGDGPLLVLAGAGSGKTRVITTRVAWLLQRGVRPDSILAVSFTNKAANEMRERVAGIVGADTARRVHLSTFHALGAAILREDIQRLGFQKPFTIVDEGERRRMVRLILKELRLDGTKSGAARILSLISRAKNAMREPAEMPEARYDPEMPRAQRLYDVYNQTLKNQNAVDFDDLLLLPTQLMEADDDVRDKYRGRFRFVMVDEYQDTNALQLRMLDQLVSQPQRNLVVVGDDDQSIYGFRGASSDTILRFDTMFPGARVIALEQNYRSVGSVLEAANTLIRHNPTRRKKELWSNLGAGRKIISFEHSTPAAEADFVAQWIRRQAEAEQRSWHDFAILYRSNTQAHVFEEVLRAREVPYRVLGGQSLFDNKEVRDLLAYLRLVLNPRDDLALRRVANVPPRGIGTGTFERINAAAKSGMTLFEALAKTGDEASLQARTRDGIRTLVAAVRDARETMRSASAPELERVVRDYVKALGLEQGVYAAESNPNAARARWAAVESLLEGLGRVEGTSAWSALDNWVASASLESRGADDEDEKSRHRVTLLTIHASKGLEFPVVFITGMNEGLLPHSRALDELGGVEEERRLCYVGMTRAKQRLFMTRAASTTKRQQRFALKPSRFLAELPRDLVEERVYRGEPQRDPAQAQEVAANFAKMREILQAENNKAPKS